MGFAWILMSAFELVITWNILCSVEQSKAINVDNLKQVKQAIFRKYTSLLTDHKRAFTTAFGIREVPLPCNLNMWLNFDITRSILIQIRYCRSEIVLADWLTRWHTDSFHLSLRKFPLRFVDQSVFTIKLQSYKIQLRIHSFRTQTQCFTGK